MIADRSVGGIVLAAGASRRYGSPKQLVVVDGKTLVEHAIATAAGAGLSPVAAVVPVWLSRPAALDDPRLRWIRNPFPERGLSLSLQLGLDALGDEISAVVILLGDQPRLAPGHIASILAARGPRPLVASEAGGIMAPPLLIERSHFSLIAGLAGDSGMRQTLRDHAELVTAVSIGSHSPDLDTPDDLGRMTANVDRRTTRRDEREERGTDPGTHRRPSPQR